MNDDMSKYVSYRVINSLKKKYKKISNKKILILGFAFKENCNDVRNTKVYDIYKYLKLRKLKVDIFDPLVDRKDVYNYYKIKVLKKLPKNKYNLILIAVGHKIFVKIKNSYFNKSLLFDLKSIKKNLKPDFSF